MEEPDQKRVRRTRGGCHALPLPDRRLHRLGRVVTRRQGKNIYLATTTGTTSTDRVEAAGLERCCRHRHREADGIQEPTVGLLNLDGTRTCGIDLKESKRQRLSDSFCDLHGRSDGGAVMRGNDILRASQDVLVLDSLTGNVVIKILSAFTSGGSFETVGANYGNPA